MENVKVKMENGETHDKEQRIIKNENFETLLERITFNHEY
jgi:hypothetical protein